MSVDRIDPAHASLGPSRRYAELLRAALGARVVRVVLYGSRARGDARQWSDWDVLVIVKERTPEVKDAVLDAAVAMMNDHETLFSNLVYDETERERVKRFPIGWRILEEGLDL